MDDLEVQKLVDHLIRQEGFRLRHYQDVAGNLSIGAGRTKSEYADLGPGEAVTVLERDVRRIAHQLKDQLPSFDALDQVRQRVLIYMAFNMSVSGLLTMNRFIAAVKRGKWTVAVEEMLSSAWAAEAKQRATELAEMMRTGLDQPTNTSQGRRAAGPLAGVSRFSLLPRH